MEQGKVIKIKEGLSPGEIRMGTDKISTLVFKYSLPTIIGMLVNSLYNTVDRIWVAKIPEVGSLALSGIGVCMPIMNISLGFSMLVGIGAAASISISLGKKDRERAENILGNSLSLILLISILFTVIGLISAEGLLRLMGASEITLPYALPYTIVIFLGSIFSMASFALNHPIRAAGNPMMFARTQLVGGIANIILDPIFIFNFKLGIAGAAIATVISQIISLGLVLSYYFSKKSSLKFRLKGLRIKLDIVKSIFSIGISPFLMQIVGSIIVIVVNRSLFYYGNIEFGTQGGDLAIGAMTVINSIAMLFLMPVFGINQGTQPIIGYNYGAGNYKRVKDALKWSIIYAMAINAFGFVIIEIFAEFLIKMFNSDPILINIGSRGMRIFLFMIVIIGFQVPASNFFQAIGRAKIAVFLSLLRQVIILIPAYIILPRIFGFMGIWYCGPVADFIASIITCILLVRELNILKKQLSP